MKQTKKKMNNFKNKWKVTFTVKTLSGKTRLISDGGMNCAHAQAVNFTVSNPAVQSSASMQ